LKSSRGGDAVPENRAVKFRFPLVSLLFLALCGLETCCAEVSAVFNAKTDVPITAAAYSARGETLAISLNFAPPAGTNLTVIKNTGLPLIDGAFDNIAHGQRVVLSYAGINYHFVANYFGGTGNDLVLVPQGMQPYA
jgi:hypothetical protein